MGAALACRTAPGAPAPATRGAGPVRTGRGVGSVLHTLDPGVLNAHPPHTTFVTQSTYVVSQGRTAQMVSGNSSDKLGLRRSTGVGDVRTLIVSHGDMRFCPSSSSSRARWSAWALTMLLRTVLRSPAEKGMPPRSSAGSGPSGPGGPGSPAGPRVPWGPSGPTRWSRMTHAPLAPPATPNTSAVAAVAANVLSCLTRRTVKAKQG